MNKTPIDEKVTRSVNRLVEVCKHTKTTALILCANGIGFSYSDTGDAELKLLMPSMLLANFMRRTPHDMRDDLAQKIIQTAFDMLNELEDSTC